MHLRRNIESVSYRTRRENVSFPRRGNKGPAIFKIKFERPDFSHSLRPASVLNAISQWKYRFCNENTNFKFQKLVLRTSFPIWDRLYQFQKYNEAVKYRVKFLFHVFLKLFRAIALRVTIILLVYLPRIVKRLSIFVKRLTNLYKYCYRIVMAPISSYERIINIIIIIIVITIWANSNDKYETVKNVSKIRKERER